MLWVGLGTFAIGFALYVGALSLEWTAGAESNPRRPRAEQIPVVISLVILLVGGGLAWWSLAAGT